MEQERHCISLTDGLSLTKGDPLTRFILSKCEQQLYLAAPDTMVDKVNYVFKNGFIDVGDLPCRVKFWKEMQHRTVTPPTQFNWQSIYYRPKEVKVDCSHFWHRPHHIAYWAKSELIAQQAGHYTFELATCGGVRIWVNQQDNKNDHIVFTPYHRNTETRTEISFTLNSGVNHLLIYFDDLAERDTNFWFELRYLDTKPLWQSLGNDIEHKLAALDHFWQELNMTQSYLTQNQPIGLCTKHNAQQTIQLDCCFFQHPHQNEHPQWQTIHWQQGQRNYLFDQTFRLETGFWSCQLNLTLAGFTLSKTLTFAMAPQFIGTDPTTPTAVTTSLDITQQQQRQQRFQSIQQFLAAQGNPRIGRLISALDGNITKDSKEYHDSIALLERTLQQISQREDCSDFLIIPLLWIWKQHAWQQLPTVLWSKAESVILGWRYWIDEPGNDTMWFWSENHCLCFHTAQYLAGALFHDQLFINSNRSGAQQQMLGYQRLNLWFDHYEQTGFVEWNSIAYYPVDLIALLALYHLSPDPAIIKRAQNAIDQLFTMLAIHTVQGRSTGSMGRAYEKELFSGFVNELSSYVYALWGQGVLTPGVCSLPELIASNYQPPMYTDKLALWRYKTGFEARYCQGVDQLAKLVSWKNCDGLLSSVVDHQTGQAGHQQHVIDLSFSAKPNAKIWVNHPGELTPNGEGRPSYWAGNGILPRVNQYRNRALMIIDTQNHSIPWSHLHLPQEAFDAIEITKQACFFRCGSGYGAVLCSTKLDPITTGITAHIELRANKPKVAWLFCIGAPDQDGGYVNFKQQMQQSLLTLNDLESNTPLTAQINDPFMGLIHLTWSGQFNHQYSHLVPKEWAITPLISLDLDPKSYTHPNKLFQGQQYQEPQFQSQQ